MREWKAAKDQGSFRLQTSQFIEAIFIEKIYINIIAKIIIINAHPCCDTRGGLGNFGITKRSP